VSDLLGLIVLLPLAGFLFNGLLGTRLGGERLNETAVNVVACALPGLSFVLTLMCFFQLEASGKPLIEATYTWATIGGQRFEVGFWFDRLSAVMTLVVTGVGTLIHVYSIGYMHGDKSHARYFAYLNLFLFFMLLLVLGRSLLVMFVGWEGVGLASYLLIGFWFDDPAKAAAGKKAFITNRIGDAGFLVGMFLLWGTFGTLDMDTINAGFLGPKAPAVSANLVGLALFIGACGKSAQIPLHVWLPDAMAGPTPVSALIHAATMVTAGIYLVARMSGIYMHAEFASHVIAVIGVATVLALLVVLPIAMILLGGVNYGVIQWLAGRPAGVGDMLRQGARRMVGLLLAVLLVLLAVLGGYILLIVPGIMIAVATSLALPAVTVEGIGAVDGFKRSLDLTRGYRWSIFGAFVLLGLINFAASLLGAALQLIPILGLLLSLAISLVTATMPYVLPAVAYHDLRVMKEGVDTSQLAQVFE